MANLTDLGGLFFQLGLLPDKNSFETGYRLIDGTVNKFSMLIGTARNAANVMQAFATDAGKTDSALYKTSMRLGLTAETLSTWKAAAKIAGVSAEGLVSSIGELDYALNNIRSEGFAKYADQLSKIGMSMDQLKDKEGKWLSGDKAVKKILEYTLEQYNAADTEEAKKQIGYGLYDALGGAVYDLFAELVRTGKSPDELLATAGSTQFQTNESMNKGSNFITEWNTFQESLKSIAGLLGDETGGALTEQMKKVNEWLDQNGEMIKTAIDNIAKLTGIIAAKIAPYAKDVITMLVATAAGDMETAGAAGNDLGLQLASDFTGISKSDLEDTQKVFNAILEYRTKMGYKLNDWMPYDELPDTLKQGFDKHATKSMGHYKFAGVMKDGILRPDGTITQVAPDDWVFAARNLGDLARAFIPQNITAATGNTEVSIVQNFTINGGSDMPQILRQQAYQGTQDALMLMQQSSTRLQLMSGTR